MPDVIMPRLSDSMEEGTILRWLKTDGENVERGEELLEIETDKATMTYEADSNGMLTITVQEGATVPVGAVIGQIGDPVAVPRPTMPPDTPTSAPASGPGPAAVAEPAAVPAAPRRDASNGADRQPAVALGPSPSSGTSAKASPLARRTAQRLRIDLATVTGSGPNSRILKSDVVAAASQVVAPAPTRDDVAARTAPAPARDGSKGEPAIEELTRSQSVIARRMAESRATIPDFALQVDVDMTAALEMRSALKQFADPVPSLNDIVVKASALALRRHPRVNGSYRDGRFELHPRVNVAVAVATDDALIVPTVFDADAKSLGAIARETRALIERVHHGKITPSELSGGTFTVSNLGMFGIDRFEGIINPPHAAILCVGAVRLRPAAVDDQVVVRPIMTMTLACDHRILYGADAARFLNQVREFLDHPGTMVL